MITLSIKLIATAMAWELGYILGSIAVLVAS